MSAAGSASAASTSAPETASPPVDAPDSQWLAGPKSQTSEAAADTPAMAAATAADPPVAESVAQTVADVPSAQVSAHELNLLTEPLLEEEEPVVRHRTGTKKGQTGTQHIALRVVGALMLAAALVFILRPGLNQRDEFMWRLWGSILAVVGLLVAFLPNILRRRGRPRKKQPRH